MRSQEVPEVIKITKMLKKWNLTKTQIFTILLRGWNIRIHHNYHSKIIKKRDCNPNVILNCSNQSDVEGSPIGDAKSIKNHQKSILVPSEWTLAPNDHQNNEKVVSQDPECLKNGLPRPRKINKSVKQNEWNLLEKNYAIPEFSNDFNPTNLSNPSSLQINSQLVARGAGGRGEALGINT